VREEPARRHRDCSGWQRAGLQQLCPIARRRSRGLGRGHRTPVGNFHPCHGVLPDCGTRQRHKGTQRYTRRRVRARGNDSVRQTPKRGEGDRCRGRARLGHWPVPALRTSPGSAGTGSAGTNAPSTGRRRTWGPLKEEDLDPLERCGRPGVRPNPNESPAGRSNGD